MAGLVLCRVEPIYASPAVHSPWLLSFGDIATDSTRVYFVGDRWVGLYAAAEKLMLISPRDSITVPHPPSSDSVRIGKNVFAAGDAVIIKREPRHKPKAYKLPKPDARILKDLSARSRKSVRAAIGPLAAYGNDVWFGLSLTDTSTKVQIGGLGWFDSKHSRFKQVVDSSLAGFTPRWVGVAADTANVLFARDHEGESETRLMRYAIGTGTLTRFDLSPLNLAGETIYRAAVWGDTLLLTTDTAIIIWWPHARPELWNTASYAAPRSCPLYLVNFSADSGALRQDTVRVGVLRYGEPLEVRYWYGDYAEVVTQDAVFAYVDDADWRAHQNLWANPRWNCGDSLCFARVRILRAGRLADGSLIHVPISYAGKDDHGIRVSFMAAWARRGDLLPVLLPR